MATTISIALQKGGTGKTTTATTIAGILGSMENKVLLVDMDSQCNATFISDIEANNTIIDVLSGDCDIRKAITGSRHYDVIASDEQLANFEKLEEIESTLLMDALSSISNSYDYIIIDTPPALGNILKNCLVASDYVLIPIEARPLAIKGLSALQETIEAVQQEFSRLKVLGVILVKYSDRTVLNRQMKELLEEQVSDMNTTLFHTVIRESVVVGESQAMQESLIDYAPKSKPCCDYTNLTEEIIARIAGE